MFLYYHKIPFTAVEVDPLRKTELKAFKEEAYGEDKITVPLIYMDGQYLKDSDTIIRTLYEKHYPDVEIDDEQEKW